MRCRQELTPKQLGAMVNAADPKNPAVVMVAAYAVKNKVHGNRARQEALLDYKDVRKQYDRDGKMLGVSTEVGLTKTDRLQVGETKPLACTTDCPGKVVFDERGRFDASAACPVSRPWDSKMATRRANAGRGACSRAIMRGGGSRAC